MLEQHRHDDVPSAISAILFHQEAFPPEEGSPCPSLCGTEHSCRISKDVDGLAKCAIAFDRAAQIEAATALVGQVIISPNCATPFTVNNISQQGEVTVTPSGEPAQKTIIDIQHITPALIHLLETDLSQENQEQLLWRQEDSRINKCRTKSLLLSEQGTAHLNEKFQGKPVLVYYMDFMNMKFPNEVKLSGAVNRILERMGQLVPNYLRGFQYEFMRLGGDEFALYIEDTPGAKEALLELNQAITEERDAALPSEDPRLISDEELRTKALNEAQALYKEDCKRYGWNETEAGFSVFLDKTLKAVAKAESLAALRSTMRRLRYDFTQKCKGDGAPYTRANFIEFLEDIAQKTGLEFPEEVADSKWEELPLMARSGLSQRFVAEHLNDDGAREKTMHPTFVIGRATGRMTTAKNAALLSHLDEALVVNKQASENSTEIIHFDDRAITPAQADELTQAAQAENTLTLFMKRGQMLEKAEDTLENRTKLAVVKTNELRRKSADPVIPSVNRLSNCDRTTAAEQLGIWQETEFQMATFDLTFAGVLNHVIGPDGLDGIMKSAAEIITTHIPEAFMMRMNGGMIRVLHSMTRDDYGLIVADLKALVHELAHSPKREHMCIEIGEKTGVTSAISGKKVAEEKVNDWRSIEIAAEFEPSVWVSPEDTMETIFDKRN